jgi:hypothetical protein
MCKFSHSDTDYSTRMLYQVREQLSYSRRGIQDPHAMGIMTDSSKGADSLGFSDFFNSDEPPTLEQYLDRFRSPFGLDSFDLNTWRQKLLGTLKQGQERSSRKKLKRIDFNQATYHDENSNKNAQHATANSASETFPTNFQLPLFERASTLDESFDCFDMSNSITSVNILIDSLMRDICSPDQVADAHLNSSISLLFWGQTQLSPQVDEPLVSWDQVLTLLLDLGRQGIQRLEIHFEELIAQIEIQWEVANPPANALKSPAPPRLPPLFLSLPFSFPVSFLSCPFSSSLYTPIPPRRDVVSLIATLPVPFSTHTRVPVLYRAARRPHDPTHRLRVPVWAAGVAAPAGCGRRALPARRDGAADRPPAEPRRAPGAPGWPGPRLALSAYSGDVTGCGVD